MGKAGIHVSQQALRRIGLGCAFLGLLLAVSAALVVCAILHFL